MQGSLTFLVVPSRQHHLSPASHSGPIRENGTAGRLGVVHLKVSLAFPSATKIRAENFSRQFFAAFLPYFGQNYDLARYYVNRNIGTDDIIFCLKQHSRKSY